MERTALEKVKGFFRREYAYFLAAFPVLVLYLFMLIVDKVFPFGEYTVASYDLSAQICPYIEHLFDVLDGKSTLFYSYSIVGGADVFGGLVYFIISPFSVFFLVFGDGKVAEAAALVMLLKLLSIALTGTWFAKKYFKIEEPICAAIGIVYAYCGYTFVANTYINWLDFLIYVPFAAGAFIRFVRAGRYLSFSLIVAACIYTCFSIACFSLFTVYPLLVLYAFFCKEKGERSKFIAYLSLSFVVAVGLALPLLIPALASYLRAARAGGLFAEIYYGFTGEEFDPKVFLERYSISLEAKWSYIFSDATFLVLTVFYFIRKGLSSGLSRFMLVAGIYTLLPAIVDESMLLLNMGSYFSYGLRFGFLNAFYFLGGACLALDGLHPFAAEPQKRSGEVCSIGKKRNIATPVYLGVCLAVTIIFAIFLAGDYYREAFDFITTSEDIREVFRAFSARFAHSIGGIATIVVIFIVVGAVTATGLALASRGKIANRTAAWAILFVVGVQVVFFNEQLVGGNLSAQNITLAEYTELTEILQERDEEYFRIRDYNEYVTANAPFTSGGNSFTVFSSMVDADAMTTARLFGFANNGKNTFKGSGGGTFGECFLGYKYVFVTEKALSSAAGKSHWEKVLTEENGEYMQLQGKTFWVYENELVFPSGYLVDSGEFKFVAENVSMNAAKNQAALYEFLSGTPLSGSITTTRVRELSLALWERAAEVKVEAGKITATVTAEKGKYLFLNFVASKGYSVTVNGRKAKLIENDLNFLFVALDEGENTVEFVYESPYPMYALTGVCGGLAVLVAVWFATKKTKLFQRTEVAVSLLGVALAIGVTAFFFVYPTGVWVMKILSAVKVGL